MNYTETEQQLIEDAANTINQKQRIEILVKPRYIDAALQLLESTAMQQIIESRVKAAKIEVLKEVAKEYHKNSFNLLLRPTERKFKSVDSIILDKIKELTELTK